MCAIFPVHSLQALYFVLLIIYCIEQEEKSCCTEHGFQTPAKISFETYIEIKRKWYVGAF